MAAYKVGKFISPSKSSIKELFLTFTRAKNSRWLGYYMHKLSTPVFKRRQAEYRKNVLKALEEIPTLTQRLEEINAPDPILGAKVDIGFSTDDVKVSLKERLEWRKQLSNKKKSYIREGEIIKINMAEVHEDWRNSDGQRHLREVAEHYGVFKDLFDHGVFAPVVPLTISYDIDKETVNPVYMGNILKACQASTAPTVTYNSKPDDLWSLVLTNLDGHMLDTQSEYLHWFVGNIKGNDIKSGEVICNYLQPFPMRGSGYHRLVFVLYKQDKRIDFSSLKRKIPCVSLQERTFKTFDFYKDHQDLLTPAGLAFFQCTWDESLTDFFHNVLNMQEPVFEYIEPPVYIKPQVQFPHLEPFNLYLDRYRDPKEIQKEVLLKRLQTIHPFEEEPPMPKYPMLGKPDYKFSWQKRDSQLQRLRLGKYRGLRPHSIYPQEDNLYDESKKM